MSVEMSGMLRKSGGGPLKRDQDRWFELVGKRLYYYKQKPAGSEKEQPLGCIQLTDTVCQEDTKKQFGFTIQGPALSKPYTMYAKSAEEKQEWMNAILNSKETGGGPGLPVAAGGDSDEEEAKSDMKRVGLDDFEPLTVVGKGSFGKVMQVRKKDTGEIFAMKAMYKEVILRENLVDHTTAEKNILGMINHPFIVKLHYAFQTDDKLYLILDFLSGGEVFYHLSKCGTFPESRAKFYTAQIGLALGHLHSLKIIYRDLKPENCVLDKDGNCCITDFGLAKPNIQGGQDAKTFCGTPEYLAPEFLTGGGHGKAVDWWSLGILLYEMITGLPPFYSENVNEMYELILKKPLSFQEESAQDMTEDAKSICTRMLDRDPEQRLQELADFKGHPFFADIDWDLMMAKKLPVPFKPDPSKLHVDDEFAREPARHSTAKVTGLSNSDDFKNFTYVGK